MEQPFPGKLQVSDDVLEVPARKRPSFSRVFLPFRSSKSRSRSSVDSANFSDGSSLTSASTKNGRANDTTTSKRKDSYTRKYLAKKSVAQSTRDNGDGFTEQYSRDKVTGEMKDPTNMLHSLAHDFDTPDKSYLTKADTNSPAQPGSEVVDRLPDKLWRQIISYLSLADQCSLYLCNKSWWYLLATNILEMLDHRDTTHHRLRCDFLQRLNKDYPSHLLCYICGRYHYRIQKGKEVMKPTNISNPLYECPYQNVSDPSKRMPRHRTTFGRAIPFSFVQLVLRYQKYGAEYGIKCDDLGRRYKDREAVGNWSHQTRWAIIDDHLYMRVVSTCFATHSLPPAGMRHLLYTREDFTPFFSVCAHWRDGELMPVCKCALSHVPAPLSGSGAMRLAKEIDKHFKGPDNPMARQCEKCKPIRRCPECPTEYLVEIRMQEDPAEKESTQLFKYAIVVTRWSDLGDGKMPWTGEWAAVNNEHLEVDPKTGETIGCRYDSFQKLGRRAVSGIFESLFNPEQIPPARLISLNPNKIKLGEKGHDWY